MSGPGTKLDQVEHDIDQAQAILDKVEQVLQVVGKVDANPEGRTLPRTATILVVAGVALAGMAVLISFRKTSSSTATSASTAPNTSTSSAS